MHAQNRSNLATFSAHSLINQRLESLIRVIIYCTVPIKILRTHTFILREHNMLYTIYSLKLYLMLFIINIYYFNLKRVANIVHNIIVITQRWIKCLILWYNDII